MTAQVEISHELLQGLSRYFLTKETFYVSVITGATIIIGWGLTLFIRNTGERNRTREKIAKIEERVGEQHDMLLRFREDNQKLIDGFMELNTREHQEISSNLKKTAEVLSDINKSLSSHLGFHSGLEQKKKG